MLALTFSSSLCMCCSLCLAHSPFSPVISDVVFRTHPNCYVCREAVPGFSDPILTDPLHTVYYFHGSGHSCYSALFVWFLKIHFPVPDNRLPSRQRVGLSFTSSAYKSTWHIVAPFPWQESEDISQALNIKKHPTGAWHLITNIIL